MAPEYAMLDYDYGVIELPIPDHPLRRCPACGEFWIEDPVLLTDPDRCPACGVDVTSA